MKQRAKNGGNDEYFTKVEVARKCISELISKIGNNFLFIEPSAGAGSFITELTPRIIGYDINPKVDGVIRGNWLQIRTYQLPIQAVVIKAYTLIHLSIFLSSFGIRSNHLQELLLVFYTPVLAIMNSGALT